MKKLIGWIKSNALAISFVLIACGGLLVFIANEYTISSQSISTVVDGKVVAQQVYLLNKTKPLLDIGANILFALGVSTFISAFFIRHIESDERKQLEEKLLKFQEDTAKGAIQSVFKTIIDEGFFEIIKKELLNAKSIRRKAHWQYDISKIQGGLLLKRTISYELHNVSHSSVSELIQLKSNNNEHCKTEVVEGKLRYSDGREDIVDLVEDSVGGGKKFTALSKEIEIKPGEAVEVVLVFEQTFNREYIYETHTTRHPIIDLEITVNFPLDYNFELFSSFSNQERVRINVPTKKVYVVSGAIFKGQGIEFTCTRKEAPATPLSTTTVSREACEQS